MKRFFHILSFTLLAGVVAGCSDGNDNGVPQGLSLVPSKTTLQADGKESITFQVFQDEADVTSQATIWQLAGTEGTDTQLKSATFSTSTAGTYKFEARYEGEVSPQVTITATEVNKPAQPEKYYRRVCLMKTTGVECPQCPNGDREIKTLEERSFPDRLVIISFHGYTSNDPMNVPYTPTLLSTFKWLGSGFPGVAVDMRAGTTGNLYTLTKAAINASLSEYPATCGLRIDSKAANGKLDITVGITSNTGGTYKIGAFLAEDNIIYPQKDGGLTIDDYQHNHTVRLMLSKTLTGDALGDLAADTEKVANFSATLDSAWELDNLQVVVYAVDASGYVNNAAHCPANNQSVDYQLNETQE